MSDSLENTPKFQLAYNSASFLQSGSKLSNCPSDSGIEIAFAGRSNAGKSSAINSITQNKKLARTSKTPGRTQLINFFALNVDGVRLVDLPGYGYAKVSLDMKEAWGKHLEDYLQNRESLAGLVLIMDIRKPMTEFDTMLLDWSKKSELSTTVLLTKSDKLKYGPAKACMLQVKRALEDHGYINDVILFSSLKKTGLKEARTALDRNFSMYLQADDSDEAEAQHQG
ncbi:YihA family ribosome biogenesis GTP-binding protein [Oleiphilus sp. HI0071]|uniref:ribosome biogenesis GTP-binding protein YihA/YsxC n=1 Tax=unclassified Oleiphilus TaxID=2631174 RepID=UPI0007C30BD8|nr:MULTISPECIES: ribosome biogenesis GTP-binding protein YihA/YsxC [unclassified Oleiphilus]KZY68936.1 YihA family ribosome biogenesis GTP-binding protein [Oleiphilus sp. HI0065]KZY82617.1 YihA family ribosome biogenesis GTP-binding protein [Oleiphilus sp. HI0071]KZY92612.1 YihA family ribosome biogenesis GTP-binding protein [Oleiphilus sp. HI0073]KZZ42569.1 YihA family ribosome biogenesis GTP-binding protein [Oleiphilus sp. HI0118]KZZ61814.1 YihA family ribosome biogenesis GTP-binding protein